jgi:hypothetical protein
MHCRKLFDHFIGAAKQRQRHQSGNPNGRPNVAVLHRRRVVELNSERPVSPEVLTRRQERDFWDQRPGVEIGLLPRIETGTIQSGAKNPANGGPFSTVSARRQNSGLGGGGGSPAKPVSNTEFPAHRELPGNLPNSDFSGDPWEAGNQALLRFSE